MNIRDHFAVTALPTILAHRPDDSADKKAAAAYQIADAMLKHRKVVEAWLSAASIRKGGGRLLVGAGLQKFMQSRF
jgi:hypothetical protein